MKYFCLILLLSSCARKTEIVGGRIHDCGRDNPAWRKEFCPECLNFNDLGLTHSRKSYSVVSYHQ